MTIKTVITQICNGCNTSRELAVGDRDFSAKVGGWREVKTDKHLCPTCINKAIHEA